MAMESEADALTQIGTDELEGKVGCLSLVFVFLWGQESFFLF